MIEIYRKQADRIVLDQVIGSATTSQPTPSSPRHEHGLVGDYRPNHKRARKTGKTKRERQRALERLEADKRRQDAFQQNCEREIWPYGRNQVPPPSPASNVRTLYAERPRLEKITFDLVEETADFISRERSRLRARQHLVQHRGLNVAEAVQVENLAWERVCSRDGSRRKRA